MGYTTEFEGSVSISPPLNAHEIAYLRKFAASRRMDRAHGPYFVDGSGPFGQGHDDDIRDFNKPPAGQPGLWCWWEPTKDGTAIKWNGVEKFYNAAKWMTYLIDMFLKPGTMLASELANPVPGRHYPEEQIRSLATQQPSRVGLVASILAVRAGIVGGSLAGPKLAALSPFGLGDCPMCS